MAGDPWFRPLSRLAIGTGTVVVLVVLLSFVIWIAGGAREMPVAFGRSPIGVVGLVLSPVCYAVVGGMLAGFVPRNPVGWLLLAASISIGVMLPVNLLVASAHEGLRRPSDFVLWTAWARNSFAAPSMVPLLVVAALLFPDGRTLGGRWRAVPFVTALGGGLLILAAAVDPRSLWSYPSFPNPAALPYTLEPVVAAARMLAVGALISCGALGVVSLAKRYRRGDERIRAQLRWIVVAAAFSGLLAVPYLYARYLAEVDDATGEFAAAIAQIGSCALPIAAAIAISRYRLFDVDAVIGRTLVYLPLMGILSGLYTAGVALFQRLFVALTGETSDLAIALTILLVASAFTPVRKRLETAVDRRFPASPAPAVAAAPGTTVAAPVPRAVIVPVDEAGFVACPAGGSKSLRECLGCPRLRATVPGQSPAIVCEVATAGR
jgi:hypothetical protein